MKKIIIILLCISSIGLADEWFDDIDKQFEECQDNARSMGQSLECYSSMTNYWEGAINEIWSDLFLQMEDNPNISEEFKNKLNANQDKWIEFRDTQIKLAEDFYKEFGNHEFYSQIEISALIEKLKYDMTRERAIEIAEISNFIADYFLE